MIPAYYSEIAVLLLGVVLLMLEAFLPRGDRRVLGYIGFFGLVAILVATILFKPAAPGAAPLWHFYTADPLSLLFKQIALATTAIVLVMMVEFAPAISTGAQPHGGLGEFFSIPLFTCAGLMWMSSAVDFVMIFVSLELVTISFYVLVAFTRRNPLTLEAGVKYLVLSALSTGFLVYGIIWIFGATGETSLQQIAAAFATSHFERSAALFGGVLVLIALGFKIAAVPFHIWVADVYQGAPTPVTAFLSVGSKAAGFVVLLRVLQTFLVLPELRSVLVAIALVTLLYGNLAALPQSNIKRLLAYSSIAHAGYL
nr:NADH-quinone oxidoreductase subunit N [Verrucomicrobiota bacterium]